MLLADQVLVEEGNPIALPDAVELAERGEHAMVAAAAMSSLGSSTDPIAPVDRAQEAGGLG